MDTVTADILIISAFYLTLFSSWIAYAVLNIVWEKKDKDFIRFLNENGKEIMNGGCCEYKGFSYTKETRIIRFDYCISLGIVTMNRQSGVIPADRSAAARIICLLITFIGGWWGIPWGPIRTVKAIHKTITAESRTLFDVYTSRNI